MESGVKQQTANKSKLRVIYEDEDSLLPQASGGYSGSNDMVHQDIVGPSTRAKSSNEETGTTVKGFFKTINDLTPSLEAIAHLSQEEQVALMQRILNQLHIQATDITNENANMERSIQTLEEQIASVRKGLSGVAYGDFVFENTILNERLKRIMNPRCNKNIQCGIPDEDNTKSTQSLNLGEVLLNYAEEIKKAREREGENDKTIQAKKWEEIKDDDTFENPINYQLINRLKIVLILIMVFACLLFASHIFVIHINYFI